MDRQIRAPIIMSFATEEKVWYRRNKEAEPERGKFILQKGQNTAVLEKKRQPILAHAGQFRVRFETEDVEMPEEKHEETEEEENETTKHGGKLEWRNRFRIIWR